jgi:hypothetical protein
MTTMFHGELLDITAPKFGVEVEIREDGKVLWVHVDGVSVLRICQIDRLEVNDHRASPRVGKRSPRVRQSGSRS